MSKLRVVIEGEEYIKSKVVCEKCRKKNLLELLEEVEELNTKVLNLKNLLNKGPLYVNKAIFECGDIAKFSTKLESDLVELKNKAN
jgi:hypothetical protein